MSNTTNRIKRFSYPNKQIMTKMFLLPLMEKVLDARDYYDPIRKPCTYESVKKKRFFFYNV